MERPVFRGRISEYFRTHPVVGILGPRQSGKTTLARAYIEASTDDMPVHYFDLEDPEHINRLEEAQLTLTPLQGLIVIDEVQRRPDLFPLLRVLVDRPQGGQRYLILGSASRELLRQSSETLAAGSPTSNFPRSALSRPTTSNSCGCAAASPGHTWLRATGTA